MANVSTFAMKLLLDFALKGSTTGIATQWGIGLSLGSPTSAAASEVGASSGYTRQTGIFDAAASPAGTTKNTSSCSYGPFSTAQSISGIVVFDSTGAGAGNMIFQGLLSAARTVGAGDSLVLAASALTISMA